MKNRVRIPMQDPQALLNLVQQVRARHVTEGESSPLKVLNWQEVNALIDETTALEEEAQLLKRTKLSVFQRRKVKQQELLMLARSMRNILTGVHIEQIKKLGFWGFDVFDERVSQKLDE